MKKTRDFKPDSLTGYLKTRLAREDQKIVLAMDIF